MKVDELEIQIEKLSPKPGDILILRSDRPFEPESSSELAIRLRDLLPPGVQGCMIGPGFDLMLEPAPAESGVSSQL